MVKHLRAFRWIKEEKFEDNQAEGWGREDRREVMWKSEVNSKLGCMGIEIKMLRTMVYATFIILLSLVVCCVYSQYIGI